MRSASRRRAFTLVELVVVVAIIGVLAGLTIPAVLRLRDVANRTACKNNLKQIGLALANYESANGRLPPGSSFRSNHGGEFGVTWMARLLPYMEANPAYQQISYLRPTALNSPVPAVQPNGATASTVKALLCPSDGMGGTTSTASGGTWSHSNYLAFIGLHSYGMEDQEGAFGSAHGRTMTEFTDGTSNTVVVGEYLTGVPHGEAAHDLRGVFWLDRPGSSQLYGAVPPNSLAGDTLHLNSCYNAPERNLPCGVANEDDMSSAASRSRHRGGVNALQGDGSVRWVADNVDRLTWRSLITVASGSQEGSEVAGLGMVAAARTKPEARPAQKVIFARDRYTVAFDRGVPDSQIAQLQRQGLRVLHRISTSKVKALTLRVPPELVGKVHNLAGLKSIRKDYLSFAAGQVLPTGVERIGANVSSARAGDGFGPPINATIAIIDTGIDEAHPDLNVVRGAGFGYPTGQDGNGHGTHVAGTAAAIDNDIGVVGVAPGSRLWALRALDQTGAGATSDILASLAFCISRFAEIDVVNMSIGGPDIDPVYRALAEELVNLGVPIIAAAGNSSQDVSTEIFIIGGMPRSVGSAPASFGGVVAVGAFADSDGEPGGLGPPFNSFNPIFGFPQLEPDDSWALFSNFGLKVAYVAPGVQIYSTVPGNKYANLDGTSMASPHVAGLFALVIANDPLHNSNATRTALGNDARIRNVHIGGEPKPRSNELKARIAANATETILGPANLIEIAGLAPFSISYPVANCRGF